MTDPTTGDPTAVKACSSVSNFSAGADNPATPIISQIQSSRGASITNNLIKLINSGFGDSNALTTYLYSLIPFGGPWAVLFVLSLIGW